MVCDRAALTLAGRTAAPTSGDPSCVDTGHDRRPAHLDANVTIVLVVIDETDHAFSVERP